MKIGCLLDELCKLFIEARWLLEKRRVPDALINRKLRLRDN